MAAEAAKLMLQCVFDGSISMSEMDIERRPYHRNCNCALHKSKGTNSNTCFQHQNISFPKKQSGNNRSFSITASEFSSPSSLRHNAEIRGRKDKNASLSRK